jgi:limonene-1,2-epoxide hydrolase
VAGPGLNAGIVRSFCEAWSRRDSAELAGYFTEDAIYHNIPMQPLRGRQAIAAFIEQFLHESSAADFEIRHLVSGGDTVMTERVDRFQAGDGRIELPVAGVFELRDGKISAWRDYFDLQTWVKQARG